MKAEADTGVDASGLLDKLVSEGLEEAGLSTGEDTEVTPPEPTVSGSAEPVVDTTTGIINLGYRHNFKTGDAVVYDNGGGSDDEDIGGLISGHTYYVVELDSSYDTQADEIGGIGNPELDLKDTGLRLAATAGGAAITQYALSDTFGIYHTLRRTFTPSSTSIIATNEAAAETINLGYAHHFTTGQRVFYSNGGAGGIGAGTVQLGSASTGSTGTATTPATITLPSVGGNNDLVFTAIRSGTADNDVTIQFVDDATITGNGPSPFSNKTLSDPHQRRRDHGGGSPRLWASDSPDCGKSLHGRAGCRDQWQHRRAGQQK